MKRHSDSRSQRGNARAINNIKTSAVLSIAIVVSACGGGGNSASPVVAASLTQVCNDLVGKSVGAGKIITVQMLPASTKMPETCAASGQIISSATSTINFRVDLPKSDVWNKKLIHLGGGGFNAGIPTAEASAQPDIRTRGYAIVGSDSGHQTTDLSSTDASWALNNPSAIDNFGVASIPQVLVAANDTIRLAYGAGPQRKYFFGTSTGGREALQQAQRFPDNYDGIVALVPAVDYTIILQKIQEVQKQATANNGAGWMKPAKIKLYQDAQMGACDAQDGLADGVIYNVNACSFDAATLRCPTGADSGDTCLSDAQIATVKLITTNTTLPVTAANGVSTAFRFGTGEESNPAFGWSSIFFGSKPDGTDSVGYLFLKNWVKYFITNDPATDPIAHAPTTYASKWQAMSALANANNPDMNAYANKSGKLIMFETWSDSLVQTRPTVDLYKRAVAAMGQSKTDGFMRFYTTSGLSHALIGAGAGSVDFLSALENWVENSATPADALPASKLDANGAVVLTRPTCRYPSWPKYNGTGDANLAANFTCQGSLE